MPDLDFAILCNSAVEHENLISILDAPIDTIITKNVPMNIQMSLAIRFLWTLGELGREHRGEIIYQDEDGKRIIKIDFRTKVEKPKNAGKGWPIASNLILNFPLPIPNFGYFSFEIIVDDKSLKTLPFRAVQN